MPELVREHRREVLALKQSAGEHQRVPARRGVRLWLINHEPQAR